MKDEGDGMSETETLEATFINCERQALKVGRYRNFVLGLDFIGIDARACASGGIHGVADMTVDNARRLAHWILEATK